MRREPNMFLLFALAVVIFEASGLQSADTPLDSVEPRYNDKGELKRPGDFRNWVFVGSNIGLQYHKDVPETTRDKKEVPKEKEKSIGDFHDVYVNPEAYAHYAKTRTFPEKTMLVMAVYEAREKEPKNIVSKGFFPGEELRIEIAVKNSMRPDGSKTGWAYYSFATNQGAAKAFADSACYQCHLKHADDDNVWTQFYPNLRLHKKSGQ